MKVQWPHGMCDTTLYYQRHDCTQAAMAINVLNIQKSYKHEYQQGLATQPSMHKTVASVVSFSVALLYQ